MRKSTLLMLLLALCTLSFAQRPLQRHIKQLPKSHAAQASQPQDAPIVKGAKAISVAQRQARKSANTALRAPRKAESVTPPATAETVAYIIEGENYQWSRQAQDFVLLKTASPANGAVVIDGSDIYIQGLAYWFPEAWVRGTIDGTTVTVPTFQYLDKDQYGEEYLVGNNLDGTEEKDIVFAYDAETGKLTLDAETRIEETDAAKDQYGYWKNLTMAPGKIEKPDVVVVPDGIEGETWTLEGQHYSSHQFSDASFDVTVYIDGSDIYIKGFDSEYLTDAAVKGTIADGKATFATPQYLGAYYGYDMYFVGGSTTEVSDQVVFTYDAEASKLTLDEGYLFIAPENSVAQYYYAITEVVIAKPAPDEPVVVPEGLVTKNYPLSGKDMFAESDLTGTLKVGVDGTDVYIQGIFADLPEAWVKGTLSDDEVTFPVQYVGTTTDGEAHYLSSYGNSGLAPAVFYYDAEADYYAADEALLDNPNKKTFDYYALLGAYTGVFLGQRPAATAAPEDLETVTLPLSGKDYNDAKLAYNVKVGIADNEVYIQGIYSEMPEAWIRGEFNSDKTEVTFPAGQCLGSDESGCQIYLAGDEEEQSEEVQPVVFSYDEKYNYFELQNNLYFNARPNIFYFFDIIQAGATINTKPDATWVAAEDNTLTDKGEVKTITIDANTTATLSQDGGQNPPKYYKSNFSVRLYAGNTMTITSSKEIAKIAFYMNGDDKQMLLEAEDGDYNLANGVGTWTGMAKTVTFKVPNVSGCQARIQRIDISYVDYPSTLCQAPADLKTEDYKFLATSEDYYGDPLKIDQDVKVGFYGNYVYIQGLYDAVPDSWVRGELVDGKLVIPNWYLGDYTFSFMGYELNYEFTFGGATLDYDADKQRFTSEEGFSVIDNYDSSEDFANVQIIKASDYTGVDHIKANEAAPARYYNISGMRVAAPSKKGIYIRDGRKFIVK